MLLGVPKEIKNHEYRVGMTPEAVHQSVEHGHQVIVQTDAGNGLGIGDDVYKKAGAKIVKTAKEIFQKAEMVVKVKEPLSVERKMLRRGQVLFTYLHLAADKTMTLELMNSNAVCIAYETVTDKNGHLPLLAPMSKVAGRLAAQSAAHYLQRSAGGCGRLFGGVPGVEPAKVIILGGGVVGRNAARVAYGMGAAVTVLEKNADVMDAIEVEFNGGVKTVYSSPTLLRSLVVDADAVIGGILVVGEKAPKIISEEMIKSMRPGSVVVDVAIDQGGCIATARPTTHDKPVYIKHNVVHYCVANIPGAVPHTSTYALSSVTTPFVLQLADKGWEKAVCDNEHLRCGVSVVKGALTCAHSAMSLKIKHNPLETLLAV